MQVTSSDRSSESSEKFEELGQLSIKCFTNYFLKLNKKHKSLIYIKRNSSGFKYYTVMM
jgi:hypothetical protein